MSESADVSAGDEILASHHNTLRDDVIDTTLGHTHDGTDSALADAPMYVVRAEADGGQTGIAINTWTKVLLVTELLDTQGEFTASRYTATTAGYYQTNISLDTNTVAVGRIVRVAIYKNGVITSSVKSPQEHNLSHSDIVDLVATNYVEIYLYFEGGGVETVDVGTLTWFSIIKIKSIK